MPISIFLSRPSPQEPGQRKLLAEVENRLTQRGLMPRTIGHTDYSRYPMPHIRSVMMDCNGLLGLAFRRFHILQGEDRPLTVSNGFTHGTVRDQWMTTPYVHLEAAIAFQLGLPIILFVEKGVILEGALESGVMIMYPPVFETETSAQRNAFIQSPQWEQLVNTREGEVREVVHAKGQPPRLYHR